MASDKSRQPAKQPSRHGSRIKSKRTELQLTQSAIAKQIGVTPPTIGQWERDETMPKGEHVIKLADILQVSPGWIITGRHAPAFPDSHHSGSEVCFVPLISMDLLHRKFSVTDLEPMPKDYRAVSPSVSSKSFAIKIKGDAMLNPHGGPSMPDGTVVIVDPSINYDDKSFVIALTRKGGPLFRQYMKDGPYHWLKALNPDYSKLEFTKSDRVLGTVVSTMTDLVVPNG
jgi:SOS-response transcriptional repressor LexA